MSKKSIKELRSPVYDILKKAECASVDQIAAALISRNGTKEHPELRSRVFICVNTYPEFKKPYRDTDLYEVRDGQKLSQLHDILSDIHDDDPQALEDFLAESLEGAPPRKRTPKAPTAKYSAPPQKKVPDFCRNMYSVLENGGMLLNKEQITNGLKSMMPERRFEEIFRIVGNYIFCYPEHFKENKFARGFYGPGTPFPKEDQAS